MTTQEASCPPWCDRGHLTDPTTDPMHEHVGQPVPVIMLNHTSIDQYQLARVVEATELEIAIYQHLGDDEVWIVIVDGEQQRQRIEVSVESAWRLAHALGALLARVRANSMSSSNDG